jgi:hypothetical protein
MGHHPDRNAQFENIARLRHEYEADGEAVISIDTKKKELLAPFRFQLTVSRKPLVVIGW